MHEHIELAKLRRHGLHELLGGTGLAEIRLKGTRLATGIDDLLHHGFRACGIRMIMHRDRAIRG
jgi:hypothetical protein